MMTQFKIIMCLVALNAVAYMVMQAQTSEGDYIVPGVDYARGLNGTSNATQIEDSFNASEIVDDWNTPPEIGIPLFGDIYFATVSFVEKVRFIVDGFAMTLDWASGFIPSTGGQAAFFWVATVARILMTFSIGTLVIEFISGRRLLP